MDRGSLLARAALGFAGGVLAGAAWWGAPPAGPVPVAAPVVQVPGAVSEPAAPAVHTQPAAQGAAAAAGPAAVPGVPRPLAATEGPEPPAEATEDPAGVRLPGALAAVLENAAPIPAGQPSLVRLRLSADQRLRPPDEPRSAFTVAVSGDLLIHAPVRNRAARGDGSHDFRPQLIDVLPVLARADLALCHLEVPLDPDGPYSSYPIFNAPASLAQAIRAVGFDACSTASNHTSDQGAEGVAHTLAALDANGLVHAGSARTVHEAGAPRLVSLADGTTVGLVSATYGLNGLPPPGGHDWAVDRIDPELIARRAAAARRAGADVVLASLHWGEEYQHAPTWWQREMAERILAVAPGEPGAVDAIIGHHAHVVQPVEWAAGRPVVFGLGNLLSAQRQLPRRDGVVVLLDFVEGPDGWSVTEIAAQPTWVDLDYRVRLADTGSADPVLAASAARTLGHLGWESATSVAE